MGTLFHARRLGYPRPLPRRTRAGCRRRELPMITSKLPNVGITIFTQMSQLAAQTGALNLSQGFPDFDGPQALRDAVGRHVAQGHNQYSPMTGLPALRQQIAAKIARSYGVTVDAEQEVTVTPGATPALFCAIPTEVHSGPKVNLSTEK